MYEWVGWGGGHTRILMSSCLRSCRRGNRSFSGWASSLDPTRQRVIGCSLENRAPGASSDCITGESEFTGQSPLTRKARPWPAPHGSLNSLRHTHTHTFSGAVLLFTCNTSRESSTFNLFTFKVQEKYSSAYMRFISCSERHPAVISTDETLTRKDGGDQRECEQHGD